MTDNNKDNRDKTREAEREARRERLGDDVKAMLERAKKARR